MADLRPRMDYGMRTVHRHITAIDSKGKSVFVPAEDVLYCDRGGYAVSWNYATSEFPAAMADDKDLHAFMSRDPASDSSVVHTGRRIVNGNGVTFNTANFAPGTETAMHRTVSLDFVAVIEGEMELELDSGEKMSLKAGVCFKSTTRIVPSSQGDRKGKESSKTSFHQRTNLMPGFHCAASDEPYLEKPLEGQAGSAHVCDYPFTERECRRQGDGRRRVQRPFDGEAASTIVINNDTILIFKQNSSKVMSEKPVVIKYSQVLGYGYNDEHQ